MTAPDVISGPDGPLPGHRLRVWAGRHRRVAAVVVVAAAGVGLAGAAALVARQLTPPPPVRVADAAVVDDIDVSPGPEDGGAPGAIGVPARSTVPGAVVVLFVDNAGAGAVTAEVVARTGPGVRVVPLPPAGPGAGAGGTVAGGGSGSLRVAVTPVDCAAPLTADALAAGLDGLVVARTADSPQPVDVPIAPEAAATLVRVWSQACSRLPAPSVAAAATAPGTDAAAVATTTLSLAVAPTPPVDVATLDLVVTPLDDDRHRGLGSASRRGPGTVEVVWAREPERTATDAPQRSARVQVFVVRGATALPHLLDLPLS